MPVQMLGTDFYSRSTYSPVLRAILQKGLHSKVFDLVHQQILTAPASRHLIAALLACVWADPTWAAGRERLIDLTKPPYHLDQPLPSVANDNGESVLSRLGLFTQAWVAKLIFYPGRITPDDLTVDGWDGETEHILAVVDVGSAYSWASPEGKKLMQDSVGMCDHCHQINNWASIRTELGAGHARCIKIMTQEIAVTECLRQHPEDADYANSVYDKGCQQLFNGSTVFPVTHEEVQELVEVMHGWARQCRERWG